MDQRKSNALALLSEQAVYNQLLTEDDVREIQINLWSLLAERTQRYTMGDSTSVPIETAEELLRSISFTIALHLKAAGPRGALLLKDTQMPELLRAGWMKIEAEMAEGKKLLKKVRDSNPGIENISYSDTLIGIGTFFKRYNYRFFAHEIPCDIDYQLCHAVPTELQGIEYINEYLRRLLAENMFCGCFATGTVIALLKSYCTDYKGLLINLYEPVAVNALGLALLEGDILALNITDRDRDELLSRLKGRGKARAEKELQRAVEALCYRLRIDDIPGKEYLQQTAKELYPRLEAAMQSNRLDGIFFPLAFREAGDGFPGD